MSSSQKNLGYEDTPILPGGKYRVHDGHRPQPPVVTPGTESSQQAAGRPPSDAVVLMDGSVRGWRSVKTGGPAEWRSVDGVVEVVPGTGDIETEARFGDCQLHLEFRAPDVVKGESQGRGNSGVFLMGLYEIQVLDCFDNPTYPDGTTGAVYGQYPPLANACRRPGEWQVYDILWTAPRFEGEQLATPAYVTVLLNGVVVQNHTELQGPTQHRQLAEYKAHPAELPLRLQDHGDLVRYRNVWFRRLTAHDAG